MRLYSFGAAHGRPITQYGSVYVTINGIVYVLEGDVHVGCMRLAPGGRVGAHQATTRQLFLVMSGEGWVRGPEPERTPITTGQAAFWETGEEHESGSEMGMVAFVIEGDTLNPDQFLQVIRSGETA